MKSLAFNFDFGVVILDKLLMKLSQLVKGKIKIETFGSLHGKYSMSLSIFCAELPDALG